MYQVYLYTKDETSLQSLKIGDAFRDFVVIRNDRPDGILGGDGYLTLQRVTGCSATLSAVAKGYIPAGSAVTKCDDGVVGMKAVRAGDEVAPGVIAVNEKEHGAIHSLIRNDVSPVMTRMANETECRCPSLLNGHEAGCPLAK